MVSLLLLSCLANISIPSTRLSYPDMTTIAAREAIGLSSSKIDIHPLSYIILASNNKPTNWYARQNVAPLNFKISADIQCVIYW